MGSLEGATAALLETDLHPSASEPPDFFTVEEAARVLRIGRTAAYALTRTWRDTDGRDGLPVVPVGRLLRVPRAALEQMAGGPIAVPVRAEDRPRPVSEPPDVGIVAHRPSPRDQPPTPPRTLHLQRPADASPHLTRDAPAHRLPPALSGQTVASSMRESSPEPCRERSPVLSIGVMKTCGLGVLRPRGRRWLGGLLRGRG